MLQGPNDYNDRGTAFSRLLSRIDVGLCIRLCIYGGFVFGNALLFDWSAPLLFILFENVLTMFALVSLFRIITTHPGRVPHEWRQWNGDARTLPRIPEYAQVHQKMPNIMEEALARAQDIDLTSQVPDIMTLAKPAPSSMPGIMMVDDDDLNETLAGMEWKTVDFDGGIDESVGGFHEHDHHRHGEDSTTALNIRRDFDTSVHSSEPMHLVPLQNPLAESVKAMEKPDMCMKGCDSYRPPRAHHCRRCKTCVCRMDHHCHVTGTCIGLGNHRYFMQFLIYLWLAALLHLIYIVSKSLFTSAPLPDDSVLSGALLLYCSVADLAAVILPSFLLFSQMAMIRHNITQFDTIFHKHNLGIYRLPTLGENVSIVMGRDWKRWFLPI